MKIRGKLNLAFCFIIILIIVSLGTFVRSGSIKASLQQASQDMTEATKLAADSVGSKLEVYMDIAKATGEDTSISMNPVATGRVATLKSRVKSYGFSSGNLLDINGVSVEDGENFADREYVKKALAGQVNISDVTTSKLTGKNGISIAAPVRDISDEIQGVVYYRLDTDFLNDLVGSIHISDNSRAYIVDAGGSLVAHTQMEAGLEQSANESTFHEYLGNDSVANTILGGKAGNLSYAVNGVANIYAFAPIANTNGWTVIIEAPQSDFTKPTYDMLNNMMVLNIFMLVIGLIISGCFAAGISRALKRTSNVLLAVSKGDLTVEINSTTRKDEIGMLQNQTAELQVTMKELIGDVTTSLGAIADYNLTLSDIKEYGGDYNKISESVNAIRHMLSGLIGDVQRSSSEVETGARQLADATNMLSEGTVTQASSIQNVSDNIEEMSQGIARNSENGNLVSDRLNDLDSKIKTGDEKMSCLMEAVEKVKKLSSDVSKIVGTIDDIAFQTNLLALNASVEAARAGNAGKGFAVVAEEVRNLATKCQESSNQTEELISACIKAIDQAKVYADETSVILNDVTNNSSEVAGAFAAIASDTQIQSEKAKVVSDEVRKIFDVVQANTATAEEIAASTNILSDQADALQNMIGTFRI